jgi:hypothetical protein
MKKTLATLAGAALVAPIAFSLPAQAEPGNFEIDLLATIDSGAGEGGAEIPTFHFRSERLFTTNGAENRIDVYDLSDVSNPEFMKSVSLDEYGDGITSVAAGRKSIVAAVEVDPTFASDGTPTVNSGVLVVMDTDGDIVSSIELDGVLPDSVTFAKDETTVLVAIEAEPVCAADNPATADVDESKDFSLANDPEGQVVIVDLSNPATPTKKNVTFDGFSAADAAEAGLVVSKVQTDFAKDVEPEYVSAVDNSIAYATLQEANGIAEIDLNEGVVTRIFSAGTVDRSVVGLDASNRDEDDNLETYDNVVGLNEPDTIATFAIHMDNYFITANEGDAREYDCIDDDDRAKDLALDTSVFPNAASLQLDENLGRAKVDSNFGDTDGDGDYDQIGLRGGRSMTIFKNGELLFDSEELIATEMKKIVGDEILMNGQFDIEGDTVVYDNSSRADDKGGEPEGIALGTTGERRIAVLGLERFSALLFFDITDPAAPTLISWEQMQPIENTPISESTAWSPEGIVFVPSWQSPNGEPLVITSYEMSGTMTIHQVTETAAAESDGLEAFGWTSRIGDTNQAKVYATRAAGQKTEIRVNGETIYEKTPKDDGKVVRTIDIAEMGKTRIEILFNGERSRFVTYTGN